MITQISDFWENLWNLFEIYVIRGLWKRF